MNGKSSKWAVYIVGSSLGFVTFKLAVSSSSGLATVQKPLQPNQNTATLCLYSQWGLLAFTIKGREALMEVHWQIYQQKSKMSATTSYVITQPLASSELNAWIHLRSF